MITIDEREKRSGIVQELQSMNIPIETTTLEMADYIINETTYIERKTVPDFLESLKDGRLFDQVARLRRAEKRAVLLIEGPRLPGSNRVRNALCTISVQWYMPILRSVGIKGTAWFLAKIHSNAEIDTNPVHEYDYRPKRIFSSHQERMLTQLKDIGPETARRLLDHFGNIANIINAEEDELKKVHGIGDFHARQIRMLSETDLRK